jgi:hypothetical protein
MSESQTDIGILEEALQIHIICLIASSLHCCLFTDESLVMLLQIIFS